ncbi:MAG: peptidase T [Bacteroidia bacterium]|nr:peptidase T [Bacteroidia bacterium]
MSHPEFHHSALGRFLRYVTIDTQSDPHSPSQPSTEKQKDLSRLLVEELKAIGILDAELDEHGYVYATVPATIDREVPVVCFCSHVDTSPDASGKGVKPLVHQNYAGQDLVLPDDTSIVIKASEHPDLAAQIGNDIITASGTTLLGADNKAGVAAIMDAAAHLMAHPEIPHGAIRILFTPDEEIGRGVNAVDMGKLGAHFGYTVDGEKLGTLEDETFSADGAVLTVYGVSAHPGFAKGKLQNALKIAGKILAALPLEFSPEGTEGREGFVHPVEMKGISEEASISFILRDFDAKNLPGHGAFLQQLADKICAEHPGSRALLVQKEQYRNMKEVLDSHPEVVAYAEQAIRNVGLTPERRSIRGGTDGSRLSFMGLPTANIFAGEHAFHSKYEWVSRQDMEKAAETVVEIARLWADGRE